MRNFPPRNRLKSLKTAKESRNLAAIEVAAERPSLLIGVPTVGQPSSTGISVVHLATSRTTSLV
jgi:hypothetical protein